MDPALEQFWDDLDSGEVHIRDRLQFALKSDFLALQGDAKNQYVQEFYLFVPNSLQINRSSYSSRQFYLDETNLIRFKTPEFSFSQLFDPKEIRSPLHQIQELCDQSETAGLEKQISTELKLLANVIRSNLRREVKQLILKLNSQNYEAFKESAFKLCNDIHLLREKFSKIQYKYLHSRESPSLYQQLLNIDEFMCNAISHYIGGLLESLRLAKQEDLKKVDESLCRILIEEQKLNHIFTEIDKDGKINPKEGEAILYRESLLNKYVLDVLYLSTNRYSLNQQYQHWIGSIAAGIAMLLYFSLFVWLGNVFVINSQPFILLTVIIYILKDRIKEWLKTLSYQQASRWFQDFTTIIKSPDEKINLGILKESFSFIDQNQLSEDVRNIRNAGFHSVLEAFQRPESILYYKRIMKINPEHKSGHKHFGLNIIFRFNIHRFLRKANDPSETHLILDPASEKLISVRLPKVYHLNLIIRSTSYESGKKPEVDFKKLRIIVDKNGIKRIEQLSKIS